MSFLIYGANGYTGQLIIETCINKGIRPIIAGRNDEKIQSLASKYKLKFRIFSLDDQDIITKNLRNIKVVLNCAGPFSQTAVPLVRSCLNTKSHYLDITGEIEVFERLRTFHTEALFQKIVILPGVGFDVVPTDCIAAKLHSVLNDASHLYLAFASIGSGISHGTASTIVENLGNGGAVRSSEYIIKKPIGHKNRWINFGPEKLFTISIPWGDLSTAFHTTGIPNIEVYTAVPKWAYYFLRIQRFLNPILRRRFIKRIIQSWVDNNITGPTKGQIKKGKMYVWGLAHNVRNDVEIVRIETPEAYLFTAEAAVFISQKLLDKKHQPGYHTPAGLFGPDLVFWVPGVSKIDI